MAELKAASITKDSRFALSKSWKVARSQRGIYTGGKVSLLPHDGVVACMYGADVILANVINGQIVEIISCGKGEGKEEIVTFAIHPKGAEIATASRNLMIRFWQWSEGRCTRNFKAHETPVLAMEYDSTGTLLATGSSDRTVKIWDVPGGFCTHNFRGHTGIVNLVRFHPDPAREMLFSCSDDCSIRIWSLSKQGCLKVLTNHMSTVTSLGVSQDGGTMVTAGRDQVVSVWDVATEELALIESVPIYEVVEGLVMLDDEDGLDMGRGYWEKEEGHQSNSNKQPFSASNNKKLPRRGAFALGGAKGAIRIYRYQPKADEFAKGLSIRCVAEQRDSEVYPRGYSGLLRAHKTGHLIAVTTDHNLHWIHGGSLIKGKVLVGYNDEIIDVKYLGTERVVVASNSPQVRIFHLSDMSCETTLEGQHSDTVMSVDVSPDGRWILTGSKDRAVCLWKLGSGSDEMDEAIANCYRRCEGHTDAVTTVVLSRRKASFLPGGGGIVAFSAGAERTLKRWVIKVDDKQQSLITTESSANVLGHDKDINALAIAPNDMLLASASQDKTIKLWNTQRLDLAGVLRGHKRGIWSVEFSPIDRCIVTGSADRTVRVWSLADFTCLKTLEGHEASVLKATFLASGLQILSTGSDGLMKLWTIRTQDCEATFDGHEEKVWAVARAPSGKQVVTGGGDSVLNVWEDVTAEEEEESIKRAEALVEKEQALANSVYKKDYHQAIRLALELGRPFRLFKVLQEVLEAPSAGPKLLDTLVKKWSDENVAQVLSYAREWNTNSKHANVAQALLQSMLRLIPHSRLKKCCASQPSVLEGLLAYSERHLARADRLLQASFLVDYTLSSMNMLFPANELEHGVGSTSNPVHITAPTAVAKRPPPARRSLPQTQDDTSSSSSSSSSSSDDEEKDEKAAAAGAVEEKKNGGKGGKGVDKKKTTSPAAAMKEKKSKKGEGGDTRGEEEGGSGPRGSSKRSRESASTTPPAQQPGGKRTKAAASRRKSH